MPYDGEPTPYEDLAEPPEELDRLARLVIGAAIEVHRHLGPGLPEKAYQRAMEVELTARHILYEREKVVNIFYKGVHVAQGKIDLLAGGMLVTELKSRDTIGPAERLQTRSYMRVIVQPLGLLINFNYPVLKSGIHRIIDTRPISL